jgi:hypothetical protein
VAHPHHALGTALEPLEEQVVALHLQDGPPVLAVVGALDETSQPVHQGLEPVADAEHRLAQRQHAGVEAGGARIEHAGGPPGEHDAAGIPGADLVEGDRRVMDLAVDLLLADAPGDELGVLRAVVEHENPIALGCGGGRAGCHGGVGPAWNGLEGAGAVAGGKDAVYSIR